MFDLAPVVVEQANQPSIADVVAAPDSRELVIATSQPKWMTGLTPEQRLEVRWVPVAGLKTNPACDFLPFLERSYATVLMSMEKTGGVLYPLAVAADDRVLDGRYRLQAAKQLGIDLLPVLTIDVQGDDAVKWVFEVKDAREHMSEAERAVLAVQLQNRLKGEHIKVKVAKMNLARSGKAVKPSDKKSAKSDSRRDACKKYKVSERSFRAAKRLSKDRPDLFEQVVSGKLDPETALKKKGQGVQAARVATAKEKIAQEVPLENPELENHIHVGDAVEVMKRVPDGAASLVLFSPPYPGVPIEYDPPLPKQACAEYLGYQRQLLTEAFRASRRGGRLAIVIDTVRNYENDRHFMLPIVSDMTQIAIDCGWSYMNDLAWLKGEISGKKTNYGSLGLCSAPIINRNHETILLFYRETHKLDGDKSLCDLSKEEYFAWWPSDWRIKPELDKTIRDHHPAPFPEEIPHRLIKLFTYGRDLVIDPYNGSGTTTAVAKRLGRRFIGIDQSPTYCAFARTRIPAKQLESKDVVPSENKSMDILSQFTESDTAK